MKWGFGVTNQAQPLILSFSFLKRKSKNRKKGNKKYAWSIIVVANPPLTSKNKCFQVKKGQKHAIYRNDEKEVLVA